MLSEITVSQFSKGRYEDALNRRFCWVWVEVSFLSDDVVSMSMFSVSTKLEFATPLVAIHPNLSLILGILLSEFKITGV